MANEPLGIFEEAWARTQHYEKRRARIVAVGPVKPHGPHADLSRPFFRLPEHCNGVPFYERVELAKHYRQGRRIWPESDLRRPIERVIQAVALETGVSIPDIFGASKKHIFSRPRHIAIWAVDRYCTTLSYPEMGFLFRRDHTTMMYSVKVVNARLMSGADNTRELVRAIRQRLA